MPAHLFDDRNSTDEEWEAEELEDLLFEPSQPDKKTSSSNNHKNTSGCLGMFLFISTLMVIGIVGAAYILI